MLGLCALTHPCAWCLVVSAKLAVSACKHQLCIFAGVSESQVSLLAGLSTPCYSRPLTTSRPHLCPESAKLEQVKKETNPVCQRTCCIAVQLSWYCVWRNASTRPTGSLPACLCQLLLRVALLLAPMALPQASSQAGTVSGPIGQGP